MYSVGVDIGATKTNFVLLQRGKILKKEGVLTAKNQKGLLEAIEAVSESLLSGISKSEVKGIGLGVPGPLNKKRTEILNPPNLTSLSNQPLAKIVQGHLRLKTKMENDANCFALAEARLGEGKKSKAVLGITLGSGVGGGLVIDGELYKGAFGAAGEIGHITINYNGLKCSCGGQGCLEQYASEKFFLRKGAYPQAFQEKAQKGDKRALNVYREYGRYLGVGISSAINLLDPDVVVIGGGIASAYKFFIKAVRAEIALRVISPSARKYVKIKEARFGAWSGAVGAALLVHPVK